MGHYCWVCGRTRPNERFSGRGHARHICRECGSERKRARKGAERGGCDACDPCQDDGDYSPPDTPTDDDVFDQVIHLLAGMFASEDIVDVEEDVSCERECEDPEFPCDSYDLMAFDDPSEQ